MKTMEKTEFDKWSGTVVRTVNAIVYDNIMRVDRNGVRIRGPLSSSQITRLRMLVKQGIIDANESAKEYINKYVKKRYRKNPE